MGPTAWLLLLLAAALAVLAWRRLSSTSDEEVAPQQRTLGPLNPPRAPAPQPHRSAPTQPSQEPAPETPAAGVPSRWYSLADDFRRIRGSVVRGDWLHTESGGTWRICGGLPLANEDCQRLCERAGAMLLASPGIAVTLSDDVKQEATHAQRWLRYLQEFTAAPQRDEWDAARGGSIVDVPSVSARACVECAVVATSGVPSPPAVQTAPPVAPPAEWRHADLSREDFASRIAESLARLEQERRFPSAGTREPVWTDGAPPAVDAARPTTADTDARFLGEEPEPVAHVLSADRDADVDVSAWWPREQVRQAPGHMESDPLSEREPGAAEQFPMEIALLQATIESMRAENEAEALRFSAAADALAAEQAAAAETLESEVTRVRVEAERALREQIALATTAAHEAHQNEIARLQAEAEHVRSAAVAAARAAEQAAATGMLHAEVARVRNETEAGVRAEAQRVRAAAEASLLAEVVQLRQAATRRTSGPVQLPNRNSRLFAQGVLVAAVAVVFFAVGSRIGVDTSFKRISALVPGGWFGHMLTPPQRVGPGATPAAAGVGARVGEVNVESTPDGAQVLLDGRLRGNTALRLAGVAVGAHRVELRGDAGTVRRTIVVRSGEPTLVRETIAPGLLTVFSRIPLDIRVAGRRIGHTNDDREIMLTAGVHELELTNDHFRFRARAAVEITPHRMTSYTVLMPDGRLRVDAIPGAEVWIEGRRLGVAPLADIPVPIGTREIIVRHPTRGDRRKVVEVIHGQTTLVTFDFDTDSRGFAPVPIS